MGQPTLAGFDTIFHQLSEQGFSKFVWSCMRQEPVVYANDVSMRTIAVLVALSDYMEPILLGSVVRLFVTHRCPLLHAKWVD